MGIEKNVIYMTANYSCPIMSIVIHAMMNTKEWIIVLIIFLLPNTITAILGNTSRGDKSRTIAADLVTDFINKFCVKILTSILFRYAYIS